MHTSRRPMLPFTALAALALCVLAMLPARAAADGDAFATTGDATGVTATDATLNGVVDPNGHDTTWFFEYGTTTAYGANTPAQVTARHQSGPVAATVTGLTPATTYHYQLVASHADKKPHDGGDRTFTTAPAPVAPSPAVPTPTAPAPLPATPTLGRSVGAATVTGTVTVKLPGAAGFTALAAGSAIPLGAVLDTRKGTVALTTALDGGKTQTAQFHSGVFQVRQSRTGHGFTDIFLRGPAIECGRSRSTARAAAAQTRRRRPPKRQLWGRDNGGRFRTHGKNSVATVRGTSWVTTDTCSGTRTTVRSGAVSVRDVHRHRTVLVRAGHSYLARR